jgi:hypothetical protein
LRASGKLPEFSQITGDALSARKEAAVDNQGMISMAYSLSARLAIASVLAYLSFSGSPAYGHGRTPELVLLLLGALLVHGGAPIALLGMRRFERRRGQLFGAYAVTMGIYYVVMWSGGYEAMFPFPVFPVFLVAVFYVAVRRYQDHS